IYDEFDPNEENEIEKLGDNLWRVVGTVDLETLGDTLDIVLPLEEEYDTLSGMIFSTLSSIPGDGSTPVADINGLHIQVESICDHRVEKALVSKILPLSVPDTHADAPEEPEIRALKQGEDADE
ncbi:MAG: transporter associated domain-containing protein, partial [Clostridia bacterium]